MTRLFVALRLPGPLSQAVRELQTGLRNARWLKEDGLHLTLAFIGEIDRSAQDRIETALDTVAVPLLRMELHGLGCFPPRGDPRVLWIGASPKSGLISLAQAVRCALGSTGFTQERRKFMPHTTFARFRHPPPRAELERYLGANALFRTSKADAASFHLFSSELRHSGAQYTIEATFPLRSAPRELREPGQESRRNTGAIEMTGSVAAKQTSESAGEH